MEAMKSQKDWIDYINRLQDRERQKIASSGLTNWSLFIALAGLGYWIYPDIPDIQKHWMTTLFGFTIFQNLIITIFDIFNQIYRRDKLIRFRNLVNNYEKRGIIAFKIYEIVLLLISASANGFLMNHSYNRHFHIFFLYFVVYFVRYFSQLLLITEHVLLKSLQKKFQNKLQKLIDESGITENDNSIEKSRKRSFIFRFWGIIMKILFGTVIKLILTGLIFVYVCMTYNFNNILWKPIINGLPLVIILILLQFLLTIFIKRIKISLLEQIEKEIILYNLDQKQIINKLRSNYFNFSGIDNYF